MSDEEIVKYLKTEWMSAGDLARLSSLLGISANAD
jgi:hypothetical protein